MVIVFLILIFIITAGIIPQTFLSNFSQKNLNEMFHHPVFILGFILYFFACCAIIFLIYKKFYPQYKVTHVHLKKSDKFNTIYTNLSENYIHSLEKRRKNLKLLISIQLASFCIPLIIFILIKTSLITLTISNLKITFYTILFCLILGCCLFFFIPEKIKYYKKLYKENVIFKFFNILYPNLTYIPNITFGLKQYYKESDLDVFANQTEEDDFIEGLLDNNVKIQISNLKAIHETRTRKGSTTKETTFYGMFAITYCNKSLPENIYITQKSNNILVNSLNTIPTSKSTVNIDNQFFDKYFNVYSKDSILALRILTSDILETLLFYHKKYKINFEFSIKDNKIYSRFFTDNIFEPNIFSPSLNKNTLLLQYYIFELILEVTTKINNVLDELDI